MSSHEPETRTRILEATWRLMEQRQGQNVRMQDIAKAAGISRQAVYLHFASRTDLLVATAHYVDEVRGLDERKSRWRSATSGVELLEAYVDFWGNYIPEIYGMAKALLPVLETDEAAAAAWNDRMTAVRESCRHTIEVLQSEGMLASEWTGEEATELLWTMLSVRNWEQLTLGCGWSAFEYVNRMQKLVKRTFVQVSESDRAS